jgi:hypothetical protein
VLTGCLEGGSEPTSAFKLTGAIAVGQAPSAPTGSSPTTATAIKDVYELQPTSSVSEAPSSSSSLSSATEPAKKAELSAPQRQVAEHKDVLVLGADVARKLLSRPARRGTNPISFRSCWAWNTTVRRGAGRVDFGTEARHGDRDPSTLRVAKA